MPQDSASLLTPSRTIHTSWLFGGPCAVYLPLWRRSFIASCPQGNSRYWCYAKDYTFLCFVRLLCEDSSLLVASKHMLVRPLSPRYIIWASGCSCLRCICLSCEALLLPNEVCGFLSEEYRPTHHYSDFSLWSVSSSPPLFQVPHASLLSLCSLFATLDTLCFADTLRFALVYYLRYSPP